MKEKNFETLNSDSC